MKLQPERSPHQTVTRLDGHEVMTSLGHRSSDPVYLAHDGRFQTLPQQAFDSSLVDCLNGLPLDAIEILIIGTGSSTLLFPPAWRQQLKWPRLGIESMSLSAACRTYNVLAMEGRKAGLCAVLSP
jgi:uncharacterized protein